MTRKNPWRGLASYEEPQGNEQDYLFCGRDDETLDMVRLIENNLFVTLYGSSGIGKTSLLKAGVIPILRRKDYFPLYVRLSQEDNNISYAEAIVNKLRNSGLHEERGAALDHADGNDRLYLWSYFATTRFRNSDGREVYPVIILDQFEEVFRDADKRKAELLLKQIYLLLNDELEMPAADGYSADTNYRFVASIREDFLFVLEDSIDENSLDLYKNNRYRLRPMKPENARQVVLVPGKDCIEESQKQEIAEKLVALAKRNKHNDIDTILLSLVCAGTFDKRAGDRITLSDLSIWKNNPMDVYYHDAVRGLSADQIRYIQKNLIREDGSRRRVAVEDAKAALGEETYKHLTQGQSRMLTLSEQGQVELLHDQMALAVFEERKAFEEKERKKLLRQKVRRLSYLGIAFLGIALFFFLLYTRNQVLSNQLKRSRAQLIPEKAQRLIEEGDSYTARKILLETFPQVNYDKDRYEETENALLYAVLKNNAILDNDYYYYASYSPDSKQIASITRDAIKIWDVETGNLNNIYYTNNLNNSYMFTARVYFALDNKHVYFTSDEGIMLLDLITNTAELVIHTKPGIFVISPDGETLVLGNDNIEIWDVESRIMIKSLQGSQGWINSIDISHDGKFIVSATDRGAINLWEIESEKIIYEYASLGHLNSVAFSPDSQRIISSSEASINVWEIKTGVLVLKLEHENYVSYVGYSPDGNQIISSSWDSSVRVWDAITGKITNIFDKFSGYHLMSSVVYSSDGKKIVLTSNYMLAIIDIELENNIGYVYIDNNNWYWIKSPTDLKHGIITATYGDCFIRFNDKNIPIVRTINCQEEGIKSIQLSYDGNYLVTASRNGTIIIWDAETGSLIKKINVSPGTIESVSFSRDGSKIVSRSNKNMIRVWSIESDTIISSWSCPEGLLNFTPMTFSPDGNEIIIAVNKDKSHLEIIKYDVNSGAVVTKLETEKVDGIFPVTFCQDTKDLVSITEEKIMIWSTKDGSIIKTIDLTHEILQVLLPYNFEDIINTFSITNSDVIAATNGLFVGIYDMKKFELIRGFMRDPLIYFRDKKHLEHVSSDANHNKIAGAYKDGTIQIWYNPPLQNLIDQTRERFKDRPLTPEERRMYYLE